MYRETRWAKDILVLQEGSGAWGNFHSLSEPGGNPITTEQALRRLSILGYSMDDEPIRKTVRYMEECLSGERQIPDRREKLHDWDIFTSLMLSAWVRRFTKESRLANETASAWARVVTAAFAGGAYDGGAYARAYADVFGMKPRGGRLKDFASFYQVSLLVDMLDANTESAMVDYILYHKTGIYYIYGEPLAVPPSAFSSKQACRYLAAVELLAQYGHNVGKLMFAADWLMSHRKENGKWDMGDGAKDGIYFPLSDSWRNKEAREKDCTYRIQNILTSIHT